MKITFFLFLFLSVIGCSVPYRIPEGKEEALKHIISIDYSGNFIPLEPGKIVDSEASIRYRKSFLNQKHKKETKSAFEEEELESPDKIFLDHLDNVFEGIHQQKNRKILIFIHGGLNTLEYSISRSIEDYQKIKDYYPIFINWHNGALDTYIGQAFDVRDGKPAPPVSKTTGLPYILTDLASAFIHAPKSVLLQIDHLYESQFNKMTFKEPTGPNILYTGVPEADLLEPLKEPMFAFKFFTAPLIDIFGSVSWNNMRRRVFNLFRKPAEFEDRENQKKFILPQFGDFFYQNIDLTELEEIYMHKKGSGTLAIFMERLKEEIGRISVDGSLIQDYEITLVGHSMGTIALNELVRSFPEFEYHQIIYLAAACSLREFVDKTLPYLETHPQTRFYNLTLHPEAEDNEINMFGVVPKGSLLAWIDSRYTHPETHLDRTLGRWANVRTALHIFPEKVRPQMYFKIFGFGPHEPTTHGEFTQGEPGHEYWNPQLWNTNPQK